METAQRERVKLTVRGLYDAQQLRIQLELRIARLVRDKIMTEKEASRFFKLPFSFFQQAEHEMEKLVWAETKDLPIIKKWLTKVRGIGPRLGGLLVANIADIERFATISKLWAYCGLHVVDGKAAKREKGKKANWSRELKTTAWKIGKSFVLAGGPYRDMFDRYKARIIERETNRGNTIYHKPEGKWIPFDSQCSADTQKLRASQLQDETQDDSASQGLVEDQHASASHGQREDQTTDASQPWSETQAPAASPEWTLGRINNMATRYIVKRFLGHLWLVWREIENLPTRQTYPVEYLGHDQTDDPWDFIDEKHKAT